MNSCRRTVWFTISVAVSSAHGIARIAEIANSELALEPLLAEAILQHPRHSRNKHCDLHPQHVKNRCLQNPVEELWSQAVEQREQAALADDAPKYLHRRRAPRAPNLHLHLRTRIGIGASACDG